MSQSHVPTISAFQDIEVDEAFSSLSIDQEQIIDVFAATTTTTAGRQRNKACITCNKARLCVFVVPILLLGAVIGITVHFTFKGSTTLSSSLSSTDAVSPPVVEGDEYKEGSIEAVPSPTSAPLTTTNQRKTEAPTATMPVPADSSNARRSAVMDALALFFIRDGDSGGSFPSSPLQARAVNWLADEDTWTAPPLSDGNVWLERYVAAILYFSFGGETWTDKKFWASEYSACYWSGIKCNSGGLVEGIMLYNGAVSGTIPSELGMLSQLTSFNMEYNKISGNIPSHLGMLSQLRTFDMSYNQLSGQIPSELGKLDQLVDLTLSHNNLSGVIPIELENLGRAGTHVRLGNNKGFTGCDPMFLIC